MFYVKEKINDTVEITLEIHDDNVFCICPGCGCEVCIDLVETFGDGLGDLYGTDVYCPECGRLRKKAMR